MAIYKDQLWFQANDNPDKEEASVPNASPATAEEMADSLEARPAVADVPHLVPAGRGCCTSRRRPWDPCLAYASWGGAAACMVGWLSCVAGAVRLSAQSTLSSRRQFDF
jgi:hypothetical protein